MSVVPNWRENWIRKEKHFVVEKKKITFLCGNVARDHREAESKSAIPMIIRLPGNRCPIVRRAVAGSGGVGWGVGTEMLIPPLFFYFLKPKFGFLFGSRNRRGQRMSHARFYCMSSFLENWTLDGPGNSWEFCLAETRKKIVSEDGLCPLTHIHCTEKLGI